MGEKVLVTNGDKASGNFIKYDVEVRDADVVSYFFSSIFVFPNIHVRYKQSAHTFLSFKTMNN